jgi:hypothetical protein
MNPSLYSMPIGIVVIALAGVVSTGCGGNRGLRSARTDGGASDAAASLGGQAGSTLSQGGSGGTSGSVEPGSTAGTTGTGGSGVPPSSTGAEAGSGPGADAAGDVSRPDGSGAFADSSVATDVKVVCGPVCLMYCYYGNVLDENGCETCGCNPPPTVNPTCPCASGTAKSDYGCLICGYCSAGYLLDENGCETCACNPPPCPEMKCAPCPYGYVKDASGCLTCTCLPDCDVVCTIDCQYGYVMDPAGCPTCTCNSPPPCPGMKCAACPYGYVKDASGCLTCTCLPDPSLPCKQLDSIQCGRSTHCRWLTPGCGMVAPLPGSGCYENVDCLSTSDCSETGSACVDRSAAPPGGPGGDWCGMTVRICL